MMLISFTIMLHAVSGTLSLLSGMIATIAAKGQKLHVLSGKLFFYFGFISIGLSIIVTLLPGHWNPFLLSIGVFSLYFLLIGFRSKRYKNPSISILPDRALTVLMIICSISMIIFPILFLNHVNVVTTIFGLLGIGLSINNLKYFRDAAKLKKQWLRFHIIHMSGALISMISAFLVVNNIFHPLLNWLLPTIIGSFLIAYTIRKYTNKNFKNLSTSLFFMLFIILSKGHTVFAQKTEYDANRVFSKAELLEDFDICYSSLLSVHPDPCLYTEKTRFDFVFDSLRNSIKDGMNELEFHRIVRELLMNTKCGHTVAMPGADWYKYIRNHNATIPLTVKKLDNKYYISNTKQGIEGIELGAEIITVNGKPIGNIYEDLYRIQQRDGFNQTFLDVVIEELFATYYLFLFGKQDSFKIQYVNNLNEIVEVSVNPEHGAMVLNDSLVLPGSFFVHQKNKWASFAMDTLNDISVLRINSFADRKEYKKFYNDVFSTLKAYPQHSLIIDLQGNGGGYFIHGNVFLSYLIPGKFEFNFRKPKHTKPENKHTKMDFWSKMTMYAFNAKPAKYKDKAYKTITFTYKPKKNRFKGNVHVVCDGKTFSMAAIVASQLKAYGATIYGSETGGGEIITNANLNYNVIMPNTKVRAKIPFYQVVNNFNTPNTGRGVMPHYPIESKVINSRNKTLEAVISLIME